MSSDHCLTDAFRHETRFNYSVIRDPCDPHVLGALWIASTTLEEIGNFWWTAIRPPGSRIADHDRVPGYVRFYIVVTGNLVSMVQRSFKVELKPVFRKGRARPVYRIRVPDEITERQDVRKTQCIRLKLLKPPLRGRELPQEDFAVKISKKTILVPMAIIVSKGLE